MKKFILKVSYFILILLILFFMLSFFDNIDGNWNVDHNVLKLQNMLNMSEPDIVFVGNSYCYNGIIPRIFEKEGLKAVNLGIATAGPAFMELVIFDYLPNLESPPVALLFLISPITFSESSDNFGVYPIHRYLNNPKTHFTIIREYNYLGNPIGLLKYSVKKGFRNMISLPMLWGTQKRYLKNVDGLIQQQGFFNVGKNNFSEKEYLRTKNLYEHFENSIIDTMKVTRLKALVEGISDRGIAVIFVELPDNRLREFFNWNYLDKYEYILSEFRENFKVFSIDTLLDSTHYQNMDHLNSKGAEFVSNHLMKLIKQDSLWENITNHRISEDPIDD
jgi:hypothetical protein